jgi:GH25 family lysozyme M1 (1,4-beta-N-acetylmuramidase)
MPRREGIDVSRFQHPPYQPAPIDWEAVKNAGVWWVAYQVVKGSLPDPSFAYNRSECLKRAIPHNAPPGTLGFRYRMAYGYPTFKDYDGTTHGLSWTQQADLFLQLLGTQPSGEGVMLDSEIEGFNEQANLEWLNRVEASTRKPCAVYTGGYVNGGTIWRSGKIYDGRRARVFAAYSSESDAKKHAGGIPWDAWQYSGTGSCPGVIGNCDLDQVDHASAFIGICGPQDDEFDPALVYPWSR